VPAKKAPATIAKRQTIAILRAEPELRAQRRLPYEEPASTWIEKVYVGSIARSPPRPQSVPLYWGGFCRDINSSSCISRSMPGGPLRQNQPHGLRCPHTGLWHPAFRPRRGSPRSSSGRRSSRPREWKVSAPNLLVRRAPTKQHGSTRHIPWRGRAWLVQDPEHSSNRNFTLLSRGEEPADRRRRLNPWETRRSIGRPGAGFASA
jgi:hypothetical protein